MRIVCWREVSAIETGYTATANLAGRLDGDFADGCGDEVMFPGGFFGGDADDDESDDEEMIPDDIMQASRNPQEPEASPARSPEPLVAVTHVISNRQRKSVLQGLREMVAQDRVLQSIAYNAAMNSTKHLWTSAHEAPCYPCVAHLPHEPGEQVLPILHC